MPSYLRRLEWPVTQSRIGITYIELALNFEVTSGLDLPISHKKAQQAKQATDSSTSTGISLAVRALCLRWMLHSLSQTSACPVYMGEPQPLIYSLGVLGLPRSGGLSKRPLLLGTAETERQLHASNKPPTPPSE